MTLPLWMALLILFVGLIVLFGVITFLRLAEAAAHAQRRDALDVWRDDLRCSQSAVEDDLSTRSTRPDRAVEYADRAHRTAGVSSSRARRADGEGDKQ
ncbi:MAG: hypothetical protein AAF035_11300 [Pseudomonadota bacterium]